MNNSTWIRAVAGGVILAIGACSSEAPAPVKVESTEQPSERVSSGRPEAPYIDPEKKAVTVLIAPTESQIITQRQVSLQSDRERREAKIQTLMNSYSENLGSPANKARYEKQIEQELDAYKQRVLELHRLRRVAAVKEQQTLPTQ